MSKDLKKRKQPLTHVLGLGIGQRDPILVLVDRFEFLKGFTAELHKACVFLCSLPEVETNDTGKNMRASATCPRLLVCAPLTMLAAITTLG